MAIHNTTSSHKGNIWLFWSSSISTPSVVSITSQMITVAVGDFNTILSIEEKVGARAPSRISMLDFNECLDQCQLLQAPKNGLDFSWSNCQYGDRRILCHLDKSLYNMEWLEKFPNWGYKVGLRVVSDHSPLLGGCVNIPKPRNVPFRFQKMWLEHSDFMNLVAENWALQMPGDPAFVYMQKLKRLKQVLKDWNWNVFGDVQTKIKEAEEDVRIKMIISDSDP
ncbi:uncharacterized protein LOC113315469 [Papaver somniferum]|uniref:uncharacterized protein LOC113315469 n=1 Tax=Papaver somniferum TaxID=3469 RepID=UPI000E6FF4E3|nr:uncharacterized protein LOC113315469 [Papaver somniferum]